MIDVFPFADLPVAVHGLDSAGLAAARALHASGAEVWAWDDDEERRAVADDAGVNSATREAIMAYRLPLERLDGEKLSIMAAHFLAIAAVWRDFVVNAGEEDAPLGSRPLPDSDLTDAIRA